MMPQCYIAIGLAAAALAVASYPLIHGGWERLSTHLRWRRRIAFVKSL